MQFNSFIFIMLFLPITILAYFLINKVNLLMGKVVIIVASAIFYIYFDIKAAAVMGISLFINFMFAHLIYRTKQWNKLFAIVPIVVNIGLLFYFKYLSFFITTFDHIIGNNHDVRNLMLPVGISFFSFQQIAYIVAIYKKDITNISVIDYLAYILYFPKILMGPLMEPSDFIIQFNDKNIKNINCNNMAYGIKNFSFGLFKKVMIADVFSQGVSWGFENMGIATAADWLLIMLIYTLEIYYDFSGYSDMAGGVSMMLNITLPINFDSPYKAISVRDFWKRWHISLTKFLTKYVYIPLGGSRKTKLLTYVNTMTVFLISGLWHGANWTFILWGALYGLFMIYDRIFEKKNKNVFLPVRWGLTFGVINVLWLLFRAGSIEEWKNILFTIICMQNTMISDGLINSFISSETAFLTKFLQLDKYIGCIRGYWLWIYMILALGICLIPENNYKNTKKLSLVTAIFSAVLFICGIICLSRESIFIYFNF